MNYRWAFLILLFLSAGTLTLANKNENELQRKLNAYREGDSISAKYYIEEYAVCSAKLERLRQLHPVLGGHMQAESGGVFRWEELPPVTACNQKDSTCRRRAQ